MCAHGWDSQLADAGDGGPASHEDVCWCFRGCVTCDVAGMFYIYILSHFKEMPHNGIAHCTPGFYTFFRGTYGFEERTPFFGLCVCIRRISCIYIYIDILYTV